MPNEHKHRGRRDEQKKKRKRSPDDDDDASKRHKSHAHQLADDDRVQHSQHQHHATLPADPPAALPFYGMLDQDEQDYFKQAHDLLDLNQFDDAHARDLFIQSVYKEAHGKELKLAVSQSCSRFLERLILLSTPAQLKHLFHKLDGHFLHLVQHRFASHCCETLFIRAAPIVTTELAEPEQAPTLPSDPNEIGVSMEHLFVRTMKELGQDINYLMTDRFASHALRVLLIVLSGSSLEKQDHSVLQSKKKEKVSVSGLDKSHERVLPERHVPKSFLQALEKVIGDTVAMAEPQYLRSLSTHPLGNPTLQLLLKLELAHFGKSRGKEETSIIRRLLPDDPIVEGTESASFINGLVYDPIGSRLLETIIEHAPAKMFKSIYTEFFRARMGSLARNEIAAYVAAKILQRLGKHDLEEAMAQVVHQIPSLVERNRTAIIKTLIERCVARELDTAPVRAQLEVAYGGPTGFDVSRILKLCEGEGNGSGKHEHSHEKVHGSRLAQTMMSAGGPLGDLIFDSLVKLTPELSIQLARDPTASRTLQAALTLPNASVIFRRKMIQPFYGRVGELALDPAASRVIDAIWDGTHGLAFIRERIAEELAENENSLGESLVGRAVWRNWRMDLYKRRRHDWVTQSRFAAGNDGFQSFPEEHRDSTTHGPTKHRAGKHMTAIELARQKHAAKVAETQQGRKVSNKRHDKKGSRAGHASSNVSSRSDRSKEAAAGLMAQ